MTLCTLITLFVGVPRGIMGGGPGAASPAFPFVSPQPFSAPVVKLFWISPLIKR